MSLKKLALGALILGTALGFAPTSEASLLLEPHIGYNLHGTGDFKGGDLSYNGAQYGMKLGYQTLGFMMGLDYNRSAFEWKTKIAGVTSKQKMDRDELGVFVGYNFPILVRAWVGHYFSNKTSHADGAAGEYTGSTTELGVGFTGLPFLSLNAMYRMVNYDNFKSAGGTKIAVDADAKEFVVGISLPFTL